MNNPLVSIVMVNYNHEDFLRDSIESVLQQTPWLPCPIQHCFQRNIN